jgi:asparagine synthase (glutamine-hydrolysing)
MQVAMCGICGIYNYSGSVIDNPVGTVEKMRRALAHRGPDDQGLWASPRRDVVLGHRRLSIIDLTSRGHQPMTLDGSFVITYNGEIYNFKELRSDLEEEFFSLTDTEVLLRLYMKFGRECLDRLDGMFAFAIWDRSRKSLFLARDRTGEKPLYYTTRGGIFAFASELKALLELPWLDRSIDEEALYHFLTFNHLQAPRTMFKGIHKMEPGHCMTVCDKGAGPSEPYWNVSYRDLDSCTEEEAVKMVRSGLEKSVKRRTVSDVPIGAFLSGGVDSSSVVALMSQHTERPVRTYSIGFESAPHYNELEEARRVADLFKTDHREVIVTPEEIKAFLPRVVDIYCDPLADAASIPIYFISQLARSQGTPVILTGDGADEIFAGYRRWASYASWYPRYRLFRKLPSLAKRTVAAAWSLVDDYGPLYDLVRRATKDEEFFWGAGGFRESGKSSFLSPDFRRRMAGRSSYNEVLVHRLEFEELAEGKEDRSGIDWMCYRGLKDTVPNCYLYRADHVGMAHSVEVRAPFLDPELVLLALSLPGGMKVKNREPKHILKKALEPLLPHDVLYRKKKGFCVPLQEWAGEIMLEYLRGEIHSFCSETGLFDAAGLMDQVDRAEGGEKGGVFSLWNIYFLIHWFRRWSP